MAISYLMLTGSLSGLVSVLLHSVIWSGVELMRAPPASAPSRAYIAFSEALAHMLCGVGLGVLFWLSWGLAAVVGVEWWVRGACFAALCWLALTGPLLLDLLLARRLPRVEVAVAASRWATTCLVAGLACAWSYQQLM